MGLIAHFPFGNTRLPARTWVCLPSRSRQWATQVSGTLTLLDANYLNVDLGVETHFRSPGTSPVTLAPRVGGGAETPLPWPTQVSTCLNILDFHSADINQGE